MATTVSDLASYQQFALEQQASNNAWSAQQAQINRDWQERMSNTAHQRELADLKAAGLNPVLAANSGAAVGSGAVAETDTSAAGNVGAMLQQVISAQSAQAVAAQYNAMSKYVAELQAETQRDYPNSTAGIIRSVLDGKGSVVGKGSLAQRIFSKLIPGFDSNYTIQRYKSFWERFSVNDIVRAIIQFRRSGVWGFINYIRGFGTASLFSGKSFADLSGRAGKF